MRRVQVLALALVSLAGLTGCMVQASRDFSLTVPWQPYERLVIRTHNGRVTLAVADVAEVRVDAQTCVRASDYHQAEGYLNQIEVLARADDKDARTLVVELRVPAALSTLSPGSALSITVPAPCAADIDTSNGAISVADMRSRVAARTSNGAIEIHDVDGTVTATTHNGRIDVHAVRGDVAAKTRNGAVVLRDILGACQVETANGSIEIVSHEGDVHAATSNGAVHDVAAPPDEGAVVARTSNGQIRLVLPRTMTARLSLRAGNGHVNLNTLDVVADIKRREREFVRGTLNGGGAGEILAETTNGSVTVDFR